MRNNMRGLLFFLISLGILIPVNEIKAVERQNTKENAQIGNLFASFYSNQPFNLKPIDDSLVELQSRVVVGSQELFDKKFAQGNVERVKKLEAMTESKKFERAGSVLVGTWDEFVKALADTETTTVEITQPLIANKNAPIKNSSITIIGNNHLIDLRTFSIQGSQGTGEESNLNFKNIFFTGTTGNLLTGNFPKATFTGDLISAEGNTAGIIVGGVNTEVVMDGVNLFYDRGSANTHAIASKNLVITNGSKVHSEAMKFMTVTANSGNKILINGQSNVLTNSNKGTTSNSLGQAWDLRKQVDFFIRDQGTKVEVNGNGQQQADYGGIFLIYAANSTLNVEDSAVLEVNSDFASAILLQSKGGVFNVRNNAQIKLTQNSSKNYSLGAALRFRNEGDMTFNIENSSKIDIKSNGGGAPAIRMYGGNNQINVENNSEFKVYNKGDGRPTNPGSDAGNQGILYTAGDGNSFNLKDEGSTVDIRAENGAAIDAGNRSMSISAQPNTYFIARGKTASRNQAIFNGGVVNFQMDQVKYFDFRNDTGLIFNVSANATFNSHQSDLSVWKAGTDLDKNPFITWTLLDFSLTGSNYGNIASASSVDFKNRFNKMADYSRMTANNQAAKIDELRVPTDADKYIFAHAVVPEGKDDAEREAFTDEVGIRVGVYDRDGKERFQAKGRSIGKDDKADGLSVYGDDPRGGLFQLDVPNGQYLEAGQIVKVLAAWRGSGDEGSDEIHETPPEWLLPDRVMVQDVTPPLPAIIETPEKISPTSESVKGQAEPGTTVTLKYNDVLTSDSTLAKSDGTFEIPLPTEKKKGDKVQIFLRDSAGLAQNIIKPPFTNNGLGNINPDEGYQYHDTFFDRGTVVFLNGMLTLEEVPSVIDFGSQKISSKTAEYWAVNKGKLTISDTRGTEKAAWRMTVKEASPLTNNGFDLEDSLFYVRNGTEQKITANSSALVEERTLTNDGRYVITDHWSQGNEGIKVVVPVNKQREGTYTGKLLWALENVPGNGGE